MKRLIRLSVNASILFAMLLLAVWTLTDAWPWPDLLPQRVSLRGWKSLFDPTSKAIPVLLQSVGISSAVTVLVILLSVPAARALATASFRGKLIVRIILFFPIVLPSASVAMGIHLRFIEAGLANTVAGVVLVHILPCLPYGVMGLEPTFALLGRNYEEQAAVLGASPMQRLLHISLPLMKPGLFVSAMMVFLVSFSQYFLTFLIGGGRVTTFSLLLFPYVQQKDRHIAAVYSAVFLVTCLIIIWALRRMTESDAMKRIQEGGSNDGYIDSHQPDIRI